MKKYVSVAISFLAGAAVGAFAMKKYIDKKIEDEYLEEYDEEITEVESDEDIDDNYEPEETVVIRSTTDDNYNRLLNNLKYKVDRDAECMPIDQGIPDDVDRSQPYNISHEEFESIDSYESDEYTFYADGFLTDSYGMPVTGEDIKNSIGLDFASYFGSYSDDQVWIRNERLQMDFSIIRDLDNFMDVAPVRIKRLAGLE